MDDIYEKLRERIDQNASGFNATESGTEMEILQKLFTEDEAAVYLGMTRSLESAHTIAQRMEEITEAKVSALLESMTSKGLTYPLTRGGIKYYAAAPFMHGFFEHQVFNQESDPPIGPLMEKYIRGGYAPKAATLRTIPVKQEIPREQPILPYDDVRQIIASKEKIAVSRCSCSHHVETLGSDCPRPQEVCISFDFYAEYLVDEIGFGRYIDRDEALRILDESEQAGLVHQTGGNRENTECICNCCPDCCTILRWVKMLPKPAAIKSSNYYTTYDLELCTLCKTCVSRCWLNARIDSEGSVLVDLERCVGCGLCTTTCPTGASALAIKPDDKIKPPPRNFPFFRSSLEFYKDVE